METTMVEKLADVWNTRDFPVLVEVTRQVDADVLVQPSKLAQAVGFDDATVYRAVQALERRGLVRVQWFGGRNFAIGDISGDAYLLTGLHPSGDDAVSAFMDALRQAADAVDDPEEKSRLRRLGDAALNVSQSVLGGVLVNLATKGVIG